MEFNNIATKSTCEVYTLKIPDDLRWRCAWAKIIINENSWMFSCISDAGNFSYRWPYEEHRTFKKFLTVDLLIYGLIMMNELRGLGISLKKCSLRLFVMSLINMTSL